MKRILVLVAWAGASHAFAQQVIVTGRVRDFDSAAALAGATIAATDSLGARSIVSAGDPGTYALPLPTDRAFTVTYSAEGHVPKRILIDTRGIPEKERSAQFDLTVDVTLMRPEEGVDYGVLDRPIGRCAYSAEEDQVTWDLPYTRERSAAIRALMDAHQRAHQRIAPPATH